MFKGTLRIAGSNIEMLQLDEFRRGTILAENEEFLAIRWASLTGLRASPSGTESYPALTVVYLKGPVRQLEGSDSGERLANLSPVIDWENCRAPPQAGQEES